MQFLYLSRRNNRSGYYVLEYLLSKSDFVPQAVILPPYTGRKAHQKLSAMKDDRYPNEHSEKFINHSAKFPKSIEGLCQNYDLPVLEIDDINSEEAVSIIEQLQPDLIVLGGGWPQLLTRGLSQIPPLGIINTHPSLLPAYRGTDVHRWQVFEGVRMSGTTIHYIDQSFDTGVIIDQVKVPISCNDTPQMFAERAARKAGALMEQVLMRITETCPKRVPSILQDDTPVSDNYYSRWHWEEREFLRIDWHKPAEEIYRLILACTQEDFRFNGPYFILKTTQGECPVIIRTAKVADVTSAGESELTPGTVLSISPGSCMVVCKSNSFLDVTLMQKASPGFWPKELHLDVPLGSLEFCRNACITQGTVLS
jgi:methionyl-tRNA formyltransferase